MLLGLLATVRNVADEYRRVKQPINFSTAKMFSEVNDYPADLKNALDNIVSKREIIGYFSVNRSEDYLSGSSELKYFKDPKTSHVYFDLNKGILTAVHDLRDSQRHRIDHLLQWIKLNYEIIEAPGRDSWIEPKIVCSNGLLGKVMNASSNLKDSYEVLAAKWKGTIYLRRHEGLQIMSPMQTKCSYWGMKYEHYLGSDAPHNLPDLSKPVEENAEFRWVSRCRIGDHSVLICGELDALDSQRTIVNPSDLNNCRFVELKTSKNLTSSWDRQKFGKYKLPRWWTQCFFANSEVVCGFRNDDGIVRRLETFTLPKIVRGSQGNLDPVRCVQECRAFLDQVAKNVVDDCDKTIYKFEKRAGSVGLVIEKFSPESKYGFMPPSYLAASG